MAQPSPTVAPAVSPSGYFMPLASPLYAKLVVGGADEPEERQADAFADRVMRSPDPTLLGAASPGDGVLRRACSACADEAKLRREASDMRSGGFNAPAEVHAVLRSPGHGLDPAARGFLEPRVGGDLGGLRVHTDAPAAESAAAVGARAYTVGNNVVFGQGQYQPQTDAGRRLIAHELGHLGSNVLRRDGEEGRAWATEAPPDKETKSNDALPPLKHDFVYGFDDIKIDPDSGSGKFGSEAPELTSKTMKASYKYAAAGASAVLFGWDATKHLLHYFDATGTPLTIRLANMTSTVPSAKELKGTVMRELWETVAVLPERAEPYEIVQNKARQGYNGKSENANWYFAIGGYSVWAKARVQVSKDSNGTRTFKIEYWYKFYDRYNWDKGKSTSIMGLTFSDHFLGKFHRQGLAQEFDCNGSETGSMAGKEGADTPKY